MIERLPLFIHTINHSVMKAKKLYLKVLSPLLVLFITGNIVKTATAQCSNSIFSDDYSNPAKWTTFGTKTIAPPNGSATSGILHVAAGMLEYSDFCPRQTFRLVQSLSGALANSQNQFRVEFDFTIASINVDISASLLSITQNSSHPDSDTSGSTTETHNNNIEVKLGNPLQSSSGYFIFIRSKLGNVRGVSSSNIPLRSNIHYWARLQRLNASWVSLHIYDDQSRTNLVGTTCIEIDKNINALDYVQHGGAPTSGWSRVMDLTLDNLCIYTTLIGDTCSQCSAFKDTVAYTTDTMLCQGAKEMTLSPTNNNVNGNYLWSNGSTDKKINISSGGQYWVVSSEGCNVNIDTFNIEEVSVTAKITSSDSVICFGDTMLLSGIINPAAALPSWNNGDNKLSTKINKGGRYILSAQHKGCIAKDNIDIIDYPVSRIDLGKDTTICDDEVIILPQISSSGPDDKYRWQNGSTTRTLKISEPGVYYVELSNKCNTIHDTVVISTNLCKLYFPSAFTPNGDDNNDVARLLGDVSNTSDYELHIYNRRGQEVFQSKNVNIGWEGTFKGQPAALATYYYYIKFKYHNEDRLMKGSLTLIR